MFNFQDLDVPIVVSPMAGGPSTPALVRSAIDAGAFGFLAGGDRSADQLLAEISAVRGDRGRPGETGWRQLDGSGRSFTTIR